MHFAPIAVAIALLAAQPALSAPAVGFSPNGVPSRTALSSLKFQPLSVIRPLFPPNELHPVFQREELSVFARELQDLCARSDLDGSEALSIPSIFKTLVTAVPTVLNLLGGGGSSQPQPTQTTTPAQRRDLQELEARASVSELMRQAAEQMRNNNHIMTPASLGVFQRSIDESGALSLKSLLTTITRFIPGVGKTAEEALKGASKIPKRSELSAREFMDVLARALEARELNELD